VTLYRRQPVTPTPPENRRKIFLLLLLVPWGLIAWRLADLQLFSREELVKRSAPHYYQVTYQEADRGLIIDSKGRELAINVEAYTLRARPALLMDPTRCATLLAGILRGKWRDPRDYSEESLRNLLSSRSQVVTVAAKLEPADAAKVRSLKATGLDLIRDPMRSYPNGQLAGQILGYVGRYNQGLSGVEYLCDAYLRGQRKPIVNRLDVPVEQREWFLDEGNVRGNTVRLTIDRVLQYQAERILDETCTKHQAKAGIAIFMDPKNGHILATASYPFMDPNGPLPPPVESERNRIINDAFEPGSIIKPFLVTSGLMDRAISTGDVFNGHGGTHVVKGRKIEDTHKMGPMTLEEVLVYSSNIGMSQVGMRMGNDKVHAAYRRFGFGEPTGFLSGEYAGFLRAVPRWSGTSLISLMMGQEVLVTPIQMVSAAATLVNGGYRVTPKIVEEVLDPKGNVIQSFPDKVASERVIDPAVAAWVRSAMARGVKEGTGKQAWSNFYTVAGKTGTAQISEAGRGYLPGKYVSSFLGISPVSEPRVVGLVSIFEPHNGYYGGAVAAPVFKVFIEECFPYLEIEPDQPPTIQAKNKPATDDEPGEKTPEGPIEETAVIAADAVPLLAGMTKGAALRLLAERGVAVRVSGYGYVLAQEPVAGTPLAAGAVVTLTCTPEARS
jgi:cell division protein FtsI (penicillin-binding protein 3)